MLVFIASHFQVPLMASRPAKEIGCGFHFIAKELHLGPFIMGMHVIQSVKFAWLFPLY